MARTTTPKRKPTPKLRGLRPPIALSLPPDLVAELDVVAKAEDRSRREDHVEICIHQVVPASSAPVSGMSDRLTLAHAIEDAGIARDKAEGLATAIARFIEGSAATKSRNMQASETMHSDDPGWPPIRMLRSAARTSRSSGCDRADARWRAASALRLGGIVAAGVAVIVVLQHLWR